MTHFQDDTLKNAFQSLSDEPVGKTCPEADRFYQAHKGELSTQEVEDLVDHSLTCGLCAQSWRLSKAMFEEYKAGEQQLEDRQQDQNKAGVLIRFRHLVAPAALLAALLLITMIGLLRDKPTVIDPQYRNEGLKDQVQSLISATQVLSRDNCLLSWQLDPSVAGATFKVEVTTEDLFQTVVSVDGLANTRYLISTDALADLPPGTRLLWQVIVVAPDGKEISSQTFSNQLD